MIPKTVLAGTLAVLAAVPSTAQGIQGQDVPGPFYTVTGVMFPTLNAYYNSGLYGVEPLRCGTPPAQDGGGMVDGGNASDCGLNNTNPSAAYDPAHIIEITVVFHIIRDNGGSNGEIPDSQIHNQIDILNEDFMALMGTPGAPGFDSQIRFKLATEDPVGNPTTGITRSNNTTWFNDGGGYYNTLRWQPSRYLNIYTNLASGNLGYVPFLPQNGGVGSNADRVVVLWSTVGRNAPYGFPYNQGRTVSHEVGHYLGLYHTFQSGCGSNCSTTGDRVCDTNPESGPEFGCAAGSQSCGSTDPIRNYMNYSYDTCMNNFTHDQAYRMRCTLEHYRPLLGEIINPPPPGIGVPYCDAVANSTGAIAMLTATGSSIIAMNDLTMNASLMPTNQFGYLLASQTQGFVMSPGGASGNLCLGGTIGRFVQQVMNTGASGEFDVPVDVQNIPLTPPTAIQFGETWNFQMWFRDTSIFGPTSNFSNGYSILFL